MFDRVKKGLSKTSARFRDGFTNILPSGSTSAKKLSDEELDEIEELLITADVGASAAADVVAELRQAKYEEPALDVVKKALIEKISGTENPPFDRSAQPWVVLVVGVNGAGKTTTIGKLAKRYQDQGLSVLLAAGDTFRAAAIEQLKSFGDRLEIPVVAQEIGSDSASVLFDAVSSAKAKGIDVVLADTAGRLQNKSGLMDELTKIVRVLKKVDPQAPHETLLVLDGTVGQNAVSQLREFQQASSIDGLVITKLDGTARAGIVVRLVAEFALPVRYVGLGEGPDDLVDFEPEAFIEGLLSVSEH